MNGRPQRKLEVMWCANAAAESKDGWCFPPRIESHLKRLTGGLRVLHLFGGKASWGVRLDIDPIIAPDVIGDAWMPPFKRDSFDVVILDPPYVHYRMDEISFLLRAAAWCARKHVIWFSTIWIGGFTFLDYMRGWLVRVANMSVIRCLLVFQPGAQKELPIHVPTVGPAHKYHRWLGGQYKLL